MLRLLVLGLVLPTVAFAQSDIKITAKKGARLRTTIDVESESSNQTTTLINGEERQGRGGFGGGGGTTSAIQTIDYVEVVNELDKAGNPNMTSSITRSDQVCAPSARFEPKASKACSMRHAAEAEAAERVTAEARISAETAAAP